MRALLLLLAGLACQAGVAASLDLVANAPQQFDFVDVARLPEGFGAGEFSLTLWIKPDARYPVGPTYRASKMQLTHWSDADPEPYSSDGWWLSGNFLLDGHTRPRGFLPGSTREGTFSLQVYGGGRLRWMFADGDLDVPGKVWAVQAWPATSTPSLLDGRWHHVAAVRRWREPHGASLELWIDGARVAQTDLAERIDMRRWWDALSHPDDPTELGGWAIGAEVMTAWDYVFNQYEDYKGLIDELKFWNRALTPEELAGDPSSESGLVAHFRFDEGQGARVSDRLDPGYSLQIHRGTPQTWSPESAPAVQESGPRLR